MYYCSHTDLFSADLPSSSNPNEENHRAPYNIVNAAVQTAWLT